MNQIGISPVYSVVLLCMMLFGLIGCTPSPDKARQELARLHKQFSTDEFVKSASDGDSFAIRLFIQAGIDVNAESRDRSTVVGSAVVGRQPDVLRVLLKAGAKTGGWYGGRQGKPPDGCRSLR
jgi:ankyrin repeat protein